MTLLPVPEEHLAKLNPHLVALLPPDTFQRQTTIDPKMLVNPHRFDLAIKHLYARHRALGSKTLFHRNLYAAHIAVFSRGRFTEDDGSKSCLEDSIRNFDSLLDDIGPGGFNPGISMVPVGRRKVLIDGSHRGAACLFHRRPIDVLEFDLDAAIYDEKCFAQGLPDGGDSAAIEYCRICPNARILTLFPVAKGKDERVREILSHYGAIIHEKEVPIRVGAGLNVVRELYLGEPWLGTWRDGYGGAVGKATPCFAASGPMRVFIVHASESDSMIRAKTEIRNLWDLDRSVAHATDTQGETLRVARALVLDGSIAFLNRFQGRYFERMEKMLDEWREWLAAMPDDEPWCVDGGSVLAACGLRAPGDLDVLHADGSPPGAMAASHNAYASLYPVPKDEIVFDPQMHFWTRGVKFANPGVVAGMKMRRNEPKDRTDVEMLREFEQRLRLPGS